MDNRIREMNEDLLRHSEKFKEKCPAEYIRLSEQYFKLKQEVERLKEALGSADFDLMIMEDIAHGTIGNMITAIRGKIEDIIHKQEG